jgi:hypothetical protein
MNTLFPTLFRLFLLSSSLLIAAAHLLADPGKRGTDLATVSGSATAHHVITEPGSYFLSRDLEVTKPTGINIQAPGVSLDLNGHEIRRIGGSEGHGILIAVGADECTVENGSVTGFGYGVRAFSERGGYLNLRASDCAFVGLAGGDQWLIANCEADRNPGIGIASGDGSRLVHRPSTSRSGNGSGSGAPAPPISAHPGTVQASHLK